MAMIMIINKVPHLTTALTGPLAEIEKHFLQHQVAIEGWFRNQWRQTPPPFYASVDIRNAGFKIAPVDTNLFPAGFNNINPDFFPLCIQAMQATIERICPEINDILIIPEAHTRNIHYLENIAVLQDILRMAGFEMRIGSLLAGLNQPHPVPLPSGKQITLEPLIKENKRVGVSGFFPCLILLNNDLSEGIPDVLQDVEQKILPPVTSGWSMRLKSDHFQHYQHITQRFAQQFGVDSWLITPLFRNCGHVDFMKREGEDCLVHHSTVLLKAIQHKYDEYGIKQEPFVVIKADKGTYGMAVMMIKDPQQLRQLNRKQRSQMATSKGGRQVTQVIIQEGVYTFETWGPEQAVAEPVVYMIGCHVVGGFYRVHAGRGADENLNSPGMNFEPLAFVQACNVPDLTSSEEVNRFYTYGVIARLALLAAAYELSV